MLSAGSMGAGVSARVASLAIYHRVDWMQGPELHRRSVRMRHTGALALPAIENSGPGR